MSRRSFLILGLLAFWTPALPAQTDNRLTAKIEAVINGPDYRQSRWGILVADAASGKPIYEHNADRLFIPASTTKLYSCATALATLGADYTFVTPIHRRGPILSGRLRGDLILVASGDPTLGGRTDKQGQLAFTDHDHTYSSSGTTAQLTDTDPLAGLKALARQVRLAGIERVDGEVLIDDRLFVKNRGSGSGPDLLTPIMVNDNVIDVVTTPADKVGAPAQVRMRPETGFVQMDAQVATVEENEPTYVEVQAVGPQRFAVRGRIALKAKSLVRIYAVDDPTGFARALLIECLRREGVTVVTSPLQAPRAELPERKAYDQLPRVAQFQSPPFGEVIKVTLKVSHNLYASTLPLLVAVKNGKRTLAEGLELQRQFLASLGVDTTTISFAGGAGGANADAVTPRATVQLLQALAKRSDYAAFRAGLPVLGVDGTLAGVVPNDSPARGKVQAKTGTLYWHDLLNQRSLLRSKALAGTLTTAGGRSLTVAMFVNDVPLPRGVTSLREGKVLGRLCEIIYQDQP